MHAWCTHSCKRRPLAQIARPRLLLRSAWMGMPVRGSAAERLVCHGCMSTCMKQPSGCFMEGWWVTGVLHLCALVVRSRAVKEGGMGEVRSV
eukprot:107559-Rhodomonas_salina.4